MPELPEVETVRSGLHQVTLNRPITGADLLLEKTLGFPDDRALGLQQLQNCHFDHWERRGKYLLGELRQDREPGGWLGVHLRMTGQLLWVSRDTLHCRHTRLRLYFGDQELRFVDVRTFGKVWIVPPDRPVDSVITALKTLGPEPLTPEFSSHYLYQRLKSSSRPIKTSLLDQTIVAGLGNIYADECLFLSGLHPTTPSKRVPLHCLYALVGAIVQVLNDSIAVGGTTLRDYRQVTGVNGHYGEQAWVYGRYKQPCRHCSTPIERIKLSGRSSHFCPTCQPEKFHMTPDSIH